MSESPDNKRQKGTLRTGVYTAAVLVLILWIVFLASEIVLILVNNLDSSQGSRETRGVVRTVVTSPVQRKPLGPARAGHRSSSVDINPPDTAVNVAGEEAKLTLVTDFIILQGNQ